MITSTNGTFTLCPGCCVSGRDWCDEQTGMGYDVPMLASGKFDMGLGTYSDIIYQLINGWKLKFWSITEHFIVTGTLLPETPVVSRHVTPADVEYQVATQGTVIEPVISEEEEESIAEEVWLTQGRGDKLDQLRLIAALEATLTQIKGSGWTDETLKKIKDLIELVEVAPKAHFVL